MEAPELLTLLRFSWQPQLVGQEWAGIYFYHSMSPAVNYFSGEGLLGAWLLM